MVNCNGTLSKALSALSFIGRVQFLKRKTFFNALIIPVDVNGKKAIVFIFRAIIGKSIDKRKSIEHGRFF